MSAKRGWLPWHLTVARGFDGPDGKRFFFNNTEAVQWQDGKAQDDSIKARHGGGRGRYMAGRKARDTVSEMFSRLCDTGEKRFQIRLVVQETGQKHAELGK